MSAPPPRPLLRPLPSLRPAVSAATVLLVAGLATVLVLGAVQLLRDRLVRKEVAVVVAAREVRAELATSHVWIEEYLSGDRIAPEEYWRGIRRSLAVLDALLDGAEIELGPWTIESARDPALRALVVELRAALGHYEETTGKRLEAFDRGEPAAPGTALDAAYDREFRALAAGSFALQEAAEARLVAGTRRLDLVFYAVLAGWAALVAGAFAVLRQFQYRRRQAEDALLERELQLIRAQKMEAMGALAGGVAHDINNHLAAIRAQAEVVLRKPGSAERLQEKMRGIVASVESAARLIRQLLGFARRQQVHPESLDLNAVITAWRTTMIHTLGETVELELRLAPGLWPVRIDPGQLEQVCLNLLINARDAMAGGGKVTMVTGNLTVAEPLPSGGGFAAPGDYVSLTICDTGPGVAPEIVDRIFEPFFTTRDGEGNSGLGLATVYGIVQQNGGQIWVERRRGGGAEFRVVLPRAAPGEGSGVPARAAAVPPAPIGDAHILVVEDNAAVRASTVELLELAGYTVTAAGDGQAALEVLRRDGTIQVVLSDLVMPGWSGVELAQRARALGLSTPFLYMSAHGESAAGERGVSLETAYLEKPFSPPDLFTAIERARAAGRSS